MLCLFLVARVQAAPTLRASWQGRAVVVEWSGAPRGSCLYLDGVFVPVPCGASGRAVLPYGGVDTRYRPDPRDTLSLRYDTTRRAFAEATVPWHEVILPLVVRE